MDTEAEIPKKTWATRKAETLQKLHFIVDLHCRFFLGNLPYILRKTFLWNTSEKLVFSEAIARLCSVRGILINFAKFTGGWLSYRSESCKFINETTTEMFSCEFCGIFKTSLFTEHLWWRSSGVFMVNFKHILHLLLVFLLLVLKK